LASGVNFIEVIIIKEKINKFMKNFDNIKANLTLKNDGLFSGKVPMVLIPRWFFRDILEKTIDKAGLNVAEKIYTEAGYQGAYNWCTAQMEAGYNGHKAMEQYLESMSCRGWGEFYIEEYNPEKGSGVFHYKMFKPSDAPPIENLCLWVAGAMAGGVQAVLDQLGISLKAKGEEVSCMNNGKESCKINVISI